MKNHSAGLVMYRRNKGTLEVLLVHPGGPFWRKKDAGAWSIPKGEIEPNEDPLAAAQREFKEELGIEARGTFLPLGHVRQKSGKVVHAWAFEGDCNAQSIRGNIVRLELPPKSGREIEFPEIDKAQFFPIPEALNKIN